jgi:hypothetical protein
LLSFETYSAITKKNLLTYLKKSGSPSQEKKRILEATTKAITQMIGISKNSPDYLIQQLIPIELCLTLLRSLLRVPEDKMFYSKMGEVDSRIVDLASHVVEIGALACINQHKLLFRDTKALGEPTINYLEKAIHICKDLSYQIEMMEQHKTESKNNLIYLFNWNRIAKRNTARLNRYLYKNTEIPIGKIKIRNVSPQKISFEIEDEDFSMKGNIKISDKTAVLELSTGKSVIFTDKLVVKENNNELYVFGTDPS